MQWETREVHSEAPAGLATRQLSTDSCITVLGAPTRSELARHAHDWRALNMDKLHLFEGRLFYCLLTVKAIPDNVQFFQLPQSTMRLKCLVDFCKSYCYFFLSDGKFNVTNAFGPALVTFVGKHSSRLVKPQWIFIMVKKRQRQTPSGCACICVQTQQPITGNRAKFPTRSSGYSPMSSAYLTRVKTRARQYTSLLRNYVAERNKSVQVSQLLTNSFSSVAEKKALQCKDH